MARLNFHLQSGAHRDTFTVEGTEISLGDLRKFAVDFIKKYYPDQKLDEKYKERILLYRHDLRSINILRLITTGGEVTDGALVEVVVGAPALQERLVVRPHNLCEHSYKVPTFCDFCDEMLVGFCKQGLNCNNCGLNYHKRCASQVANNCSGVKQRASPATPLVVVSALVVVAGVVAFLARKQFFQ